MNKRPLLSGHSGGVGVHRKSVATMTEGKGVHRKLPAVARSGNAGACLESGDGIHAWFDALSARLRRVRVCCGDWKRVLGPAVTTCIGTTGVFLDPPYSIADRSDVYSHESRDIAQDVAVWARENGDNPDLRIALCGYEGEHEMPDTWECVVWTPSGGYGSQGEGQGRKNKGRERIWFSPYCRRVTLF